MRKCGSQGQCATIRAARDAAPGLMAPALPAWVKQGNQGGGWWLSKVIVEVEAKGQAGLASEQGRREPGWASTATRANNYRGKDMSGRWMIKTRRKDNQHCGIRPLEVCCCAFVLVAVLY